MNSSLCSSCSAWFYTRGQNVGLFLLRISMAIIFIYAGYHKIFGDMHGFTTMVAGLGFPAPAFFAWAAALSEFIGGVAMILGILTRMSSIPLIIIMIVSVYATRFSGLMGMAPAIALLGSSLAIFFIGPGSWTLCETGSCTVGFWCGCNRSKPAPFQQSNHTCACESQKNKMKQGCCKSTK